MKEQYNMNKIFVKLEHGLSQKIWKIGNYYISFSFGRTFVILIEIIFNTHSNVNNFKLLGMGGIINFFFMDVPDIVNKNQWWALYFCDLKIEYYKITREQWKKFIDYTGLLSKDVNNNA